MAVIFVHLLPSLVPPRALAGGTAIVVDVLRATTTIVHALASGCSDVRPCLEIEDAQALASEFPRKTVLLGGERGGRPIPGFDLGNSPGEYRPEVCQGKTLVMTTTNGTRAVLASLEADRILIGAFVNLRATLGAILDDRRTTHLVCAGTEGWTSYEDALFASAVVGELIGRGWTPGNDSAELSLHVWGDLGPRLGALAGDEAPLAPWLGKGRGGRNVLALGLAADIHEAARIDAVPLVAEVRRDPLRIVEVSSSR